MPRRTLNRSRVHMLTVAAARLEGDRANPALITALRAAAKETADARAQGRNYDERERKRIDRQRTLFGAVLNGPAKDALRTAMLQRAYDLLWDGDCSGCDALMEFLPSTDVEQMLSAWEADQLGKAPRSIWYEVA